MLFKWFTLCLLLALLSFAHARKSANSASTRTIQPRPVDIPEASLDRQSKDIRFEEDDNLNDEDGNDIIEDEEDEELDENENGGEDGDGNDDAADEESDDGEDTNLEDDEAELAENLENKVREADSKELEELAQELRQRPDVDRVEIQPRATNRRRRNGRRRGGRRSGRRGNGRRANRRCGTRGRRGRRGQRRGSNLRRRSGFNRRQSNNKRNGQRKNLSQKRNQTSNAQTSKLP